MDAEMASVVQDGRTMDEGRRRDALRLARMDEALQGVLSRSLPTGLLEEIFQEPVGDDIKLLGDVISPLGELTFDVEDFFDPE